MKKKIAINGFGRIGRLSLRNLLNNPEIDVVAVNDLTDNATLAHLFKYDTAQGLFPGEVSSTDSEIIINGKAIFAGSERDPSNLPWKKMGIDVVLECTGVFRTLETAGKHLEAGAKKVLLSAPAKSGGIPTVVLGVNHDILKPEDKVISNASCTTNCLSPMVRIVMDNWGLKEAFMTTVHAYTADQRLQDAPHRDLRRARAAAVNIVPTSTGAAKAVGLVIPEAAGKITAIALRVPVITGSLTELNCLLEKDVSVEDVNQAFKKAAEGPFKGILEYSDAELVSSDIIGNPHSCIFDSGMTHTQGKRMLKILGWYDNEAGYSARLADVAAML